MSSNIQLYCQPHKAITHQQLISEQPVMMKVKAYGMTLDLYCSDNKKLFCKSVSTKKQIEFVNFLFKPRVSKENGTTEFVFVDEKPYFVQFNSDDESKAMVFKQQMRSSRRQNGTHEEDLDVNTFKQKISSTNPRWSNIKDFEYISIRGGDETFFEDVVSQYINSHGFNLGTRPIYQWLKYVIRQKIIKGDVVLMNEKKKSPILEKWHVYKDTFYESFAKESISLPLEQDKEINVIDFFKDGYIENGPTLNVSKNDPPTSFTGNDYILYLKLCDSFQTDNSWLNATTIEEVINVYDVCKDTAVLLRMSLVDKYMEELTINQENPIDRISTWVDLEAIIKKSKKVVLISNTTGHSHWFTLIADLKLKVINVMCSLQGYKVTKPGVLLNLLEDAAEISGCSLDPIEWRITIEEGESYPKQNNMNDCAIYAILNATASLRGMNRALWTSNDCQILRRAMTQKIVTFPDRQGNSKRKESSLSNARVLRQNANKRNRKNREHPHPSSVVGVIDDPTVPNIIDISVNENDLGNLNFVGDDGDKGDGSTCLEKTTSVKDNNVKGDGNSCFEKTTPVNNKEDDAKLHMGSNDSLNVKEQEQKYSDSLLLNDSEAFGYGGDNSDGNSCFENTTPVEGKEDDAKLHMGSNTSSSEELIDFFAGGKGDGKTVGQNDGAVKGMHLRKFKHHDQLDVKEKCDIYVFEYGVMSFAVTGTKDEDDEDLRSKAEKVYKELERLFVSPSSAKLKCNRCEAVLETGLQMMCHMETSLRNGRCVVGVNPRDLESVYTQGYPTAFLVKDNVMKLLTRTMLDDNAKLDWLDPKCIPYSNGPTAKHRYSCAKKENKRENDLMGGGKKNAGNTLNDLINGKNKFLKDNPRPDLVILPLLLNLSFLNINLK